MRINKSNMNKNADIVNNTLGNWTSNSNWLLSAFALFLQQFIIGIIVIIPGIILMISTYGMPLNDLLMQNIVIVIGIIVLIIIIALISLYFQLGVTKASLNFAFTGKYNLSDFFMGYKYYGRGLLLALLYGLILIASSLPGFIMFIWASSYFNVTLLVISAIIMIVPAIFIQILFSQVFFLLVDKGLSPTESISEGIEVMKGLKLKYFSLFLVVGILIYIPFFIITFALEYMNEGIYAVGQFILGLLGLIISSYIISLRSTFYKEIKENDIENASYSNNE